MTRLSELDRQKRETSRRAIRVLAGSASLCGVLLSVGACQEPAWPDPCPQGQRFSPRACADRLSKEVCTWTAKKHADDKRTLEEIYSEPKASGSSGPRAWQWVDIVEVKRCGCAFQWMTDCFLATEMDRDGYFVVATGAPGCAQSKVLDNKVLDIERGQCGALGKVTMSRAEIGP